LAKLSKYLIKDWLTTFAVAMLLITFAFSIGAIYKAIDIMAKGLPVSVVGRFFIYNLPYSIAYTIPISALFSTLLLFGRLSADSEISAMKSGGLSLWQIASPIILTSCLLTLICLYNNFVVYPKATYANRKLIKSMGVEDPIKLLEEGRFIRDIPGYMIYVGKKSRNRVKDLIIYDVDEQGKISRTLRAASGVISADRENAVLKIDLFDVRIEDFGSADDAGNPNYISVEKLPRRFDIQELMGEDEVSKKRKNLSISELAWRIRNPEREYELLDKDQLAVQQSRDRIELNQRICLAIAPFMFVLIAIPLGIKSHRKESSSGMVLSLAVMFVYYLFIILSETFDNAVYLRPWLLPWVPIIGGQIVGLILLRRVN
jgi:lipopolysaccharide export system permease protein